MNVPTVTACAAVATELGSSDAFKVALLVILSGFIPVTIAAFLLVRRTKKALEFGRVMQVLGITDTEGEFARDRVTEQYATSNYLLPVSFAWIVSMLGLFALLFGVDLVSKHIGKQDFLLTGLLVGDATVLQPQRYQSMMVLSLGFCGALLWSMQNMLRRLSAGDLTPTVYLSAGIRMTLAPVLALMLSNVLARPSVILWSSNALATVAFLVGFFPDAALQYVRERAGPAFGAPAARLFRDSRVSDDLPLGMIEGIDVYDRARLAEIGIQDAQNLASANIIELIVRTSFNPLQLIDWIAQAKLYVAFKDDIRALRKSQIRSMFDMLPAIENEAYLLGISTATGLSAANLRHYCATLNRDPSVKRLLSFQQRLCAPLADPDRSAASATVSDAPNATAV